MVDSKLVLALGAAITLANPSASMALSQSLAGVGVSQAPFSSLAPGSTETVYIGNMGSNGSPMKLVAHVQAQIDNSANDVPACFAIRMPYPGFGNNAPQNLCQSTTPINISSCSERDNIATCNTTAPHGLVVGGSVTLTGVSPQDYDGGPRVIGAVTPTTFSYQVADRAVSLPSGSGGYVSPGCDWQTVKEGSVDDATFGKEYQVPARQIISIELTGFYTNLLQFGGLGAQGAATPSFAPVSLPILVQNYSDYPAPCGTNVSFNYFLGGFIEASPTYPDQGSLDFEPPTSTQ